jgi:hypothetical protein
MKPALTPTPFSFKTLRLVMLALNEAAQDERTLERTKASGEVEKTEVESACK